MSDFQKDFLREPGRLPGQPPGPFIVLGALGKHPGWDDHIEGLLDTETLALFKNVFYIEGIRRQIESGTWDKPEVARDLIDFDHYLLWVRGEQFLLGRLWASSDGRGRTKYPMILCVQCSGLPLDWALENVLPKLDQTREACRSARTADEVRQIVQKAQGDLRERANATPVPSYAKPLLDRAAFLAAPELGPEHLGLMRILHELESNFFAFRRAKSGKTVGGKVRAQTIRVPRGVESAAASLLAWKEFFNLMLPRDLPLLFLAPAGKLWVDVCAGEPSVNEMFPMRVQSVGIASSVPYEIGPDIKASCAELVQQFETGTVLPSWQTQIIKKSDVKPAPPKATETAPPPAKRSNFKIFGIGAGLLVLLLAICVILLPKPAPPKMPAPVAPAEAVQETKPKEAPPVVAPPDQTPPIAISQTIQVVGANPVPFTLEGSDPKGRPIAFQIVAPPSHGKLQGDPPALRFLPDPGFSGKDSFAFETVRDKITSEPATITVRVRQSLQPPRISPVNDQSIEVGEKFKPVLLTVTEDNNPAARLTVELQSSDNQWLPAKSLTLDGIGGNWTVRINPSPSSVGAANVAIIAADGDGNTSTNRFHLTVREASWTPPSLEREGPDRQVVRLGSEIAPVAFRVSDRKTPAERLAWVFDSTNRALLPPDGIHVRRAGDSWQVLAQAAPGQTGAASVTVTVKNEGGLAATNQFAIVVQAPLPAPSFLQPLGDILIKRGQDFQSVVKISGGEIPATQLQLNARVEPDKWVAVSVLGDGAERTVELAAHDVKPGRGKLILLLSNGETSASEESMIEVLAPEAPVFVSAPQGITEIPPGKASPPIEFVISNRSGPADQIHFSVASRDQKTISDDHLKVSNDGSAWHLQITPNDGATGGVSLEAVAADAFGGSATNLFQVSISAPAGIFRNSLGMEFVWVDNLPGTEKASWDAAHQHGGWVAKYLVRQKDFTAVMHANPSIHKEGDAYPVDNMSAANVDEFCQNLTAQDQRSLPDGWSYQLLTVAQWKFCVADCRGEDCILRHQHPEPVGSLPANSLGIFDIIGNVYEVVLDEDHVKWVAGANYEQVKTAAQALNSRYPFAPNKWSGFRIAIAPVLQNP